MTMMSLTAQESGQYETAIYVAQLMIWRVLKASAVKGWQGQPIKI
jgi:hypothetical protein